MHGTRTIQSLITKISANILEQIIANDSDLEKSPAHLALRSMIEHMESEVVDLIMDMHGNHVVQTLLMMFKASENPMDSDMPGSSVTSQYT